MSSKKVIEQKTCKVCEHVWFPRTPERPLICPKCKSARWDIGRVRAPGAGKKPST